MKTIINETIPTLTGEIWKDVLGYEGSYLVSNKGRVYSRSRHRYNGGDGIGRFYQGRILKGEYCKGYYCVALLKDAKHKLCKVHRLVATAFIPNPENKPNIDHINGIKQDNRVENLRWATDKENINNPNTLWKWAPPRIGGKNPQARSVVSVNIKNGEVHYYGAMREALEDIGVKDPKYIAQCCNGKKNVYKGCRWYDQQTYADIVRSK